MTKQEKSQSATTYRFDDDALSIIERFIEKKANEGLKITKIATLHKALKLLEEIELKETRKRK